MKRLTLLLVSIFAMGALMAQPKGGGIVTQYANMNGTRSALYTQMNPATTFITSQSYTDYSNDTAQVADDFVVPTGEDWHITEVSVFGGFDDGSGPDATTTFIVQFFSDNGGLPGSVLFEESGLSFTEASGRYDFTLTNAVDLSGGTYWISVIAQMPWSPQGNWGPIWSVDVSAGEFSAHRDPNNVLGGIWPATWTSTHVKWPSTDKLDFCFELQGTSTPTPIIPISNWAIIFGIFLIGTFIVVRYGRRIIA